jgi:choline dehydrogenase-like flavoprotein
VHSILYDEASGLASGVKVIDAKTKEELVFNARLIFVNASALNTNLILLNSRSNRFPHGLGNDNGLLGTHVCFQNYRAAVTGEIEGFEDKYYEVNRPSECIIPNFRNVHEQETDFRGGYVIFSGANRDRINDDGVDPGVDPGVGPAFKQAISQPGKWTAYMYMQGETIPKPTNRVYLSPDKNDQWGIPLLVTSVDYDENDDRMVKDFVAEGRAMFEAAGFRNIKIHENRQPPGLDIHEMGGVRMGDDPKTSLLNKHNQMHLVRNVYVTDGACMTSTGNQSPSILYMALTARAVDHAVKTMNG